jgi:hypothetical protein
MVWALAQTKRLNWGYCDSANYSRNPEYPLARFFVRHWIVIQQSLFDFKTLEAPRKIRRPIT